MFFVSYKCSYCQLPHRFINFWASFLEFYFSACKASVKLHFTTKILKENQISIDFSFQVLICLLKFKPKSTRIFNKFLKRLKSTLSYSYRLTANEGSKWCMKQSVRNFKSCVPIHYYENDTTGLEKRY